MSDNTASKNAEAVTIQMLYFASARTSINKSSESLSLSPSSASFSSPAKFKEYLFQTYYEDNEEFKKVLHKSAISLNEEIVYDDEKMELKDGDVVAVIPPVSGG